MEKIFKAMYLQMKIKLWVASKSQNVVEIIEKYIKT